MSENKNDGGPAFAAAAENGHQAGMSLRDYFAAKAMQGLINNPDGLKRVFGVAKTEKRTASEVTSAVSYQMADAMLKERER